MHYSVFGRFILPSRSIQRALYKSLVTMGRLNTWSLKVYCYFASLYVADFVKATFLMEM